MIALTDRSAIQIAVSKSLFMRTASAGRFEFSDGPTRGNQAFPCGRAENLFKPVVNHRGFFLDAGFFHGCFQKLRLNQ